MNYTDVCSCGSNWQWVAFKSSNDFVPWGNWPLPETDKAKLHHWIKNDLNSMKIIIRMLYSWSVPFSRINCRKIAIPHKFCWGVCVLLRCIYICSAGGFLSISYTTVGERTVALNFFACCSITQTPTGQSKVWWCHARKMVVIYFKRI